MTKKIGLLLLYLFVIFGFGVSFANPIAMDDYRELPDICYRLKNVEIDGYKVIIEYGERDIRKKQTDGSVRANPDKRQREIYEPKAKECTKCSSSWRSKVYLLDKNISTADITQENIDTLAIYVGDIYDSDCTSHYDIINTYKITNNGNNYEIVSTDTKDLEKIREFPLFRLLAVIIETIVLFFIAKLFRKKDELVQEIGYEKNELSNKKLLLWGVIPTTITLPLLWFVLPLIMGDGNLYIVVGEILVATIEAIMLKYGLNISRKKAIITSILGNLFSFLVILLFNLYQNLHSYFIRAIIKAAIFLFGFIFIEGIILFFEGKSLKEGISNKKLITCGLLISLIDIVLIFLNMRLFTDLILVKSEIPMLISIIISKLLVDIFIIKGWRKISWKNSILIGILFNLYLIAIMLAFDYFIK